MDYQAPDSEESEPYRWQENMELFYTFPPFVENTLVMLQHGHFLFILGVDKNFASNVMYRYHPSTGLCVQLHSLPGCPLGGAAIARTEQFILVAGGMLVDQDTTYEDFESKFPGATSNAFVYAIAENDWRKVPPIPMKVVDAAACRLNGMIYVAGGRSPEAEGKISKMWAYNFISKSWISKCSMTCTRADFILESVLGNLYAVGTWMDDSDSEPYIEMYEPQPNQWTRIEMNASLDISRAKSFIIQNDIYVLGGQEESTEDSSEMVFVVDVSNRKIEIVDLKMPTAVDGKVCAIVRC